MIKTNILIIIFLCLLGIFLYFWKLEEIPNGLYIDEASPGYNAYSILKTGKDEYGKSFPILFRFQGLYAPSLYTYLTIIPVKLFGLSIFSVRLIASLAGLLSVVIVYKLIKAFELEIQKPAFVFGLVVYILTPWLLFHSRNGYEASLGYLLFSIGAFFCWLSIKDIKKLKTALFLLSLSSYASHPYRILSPVLGAVFLLVFAKDLKLRKNFKKVISAVVVATVVQLPYLTIVKTYAFNIKSELVSYETGSLINRILEFFSQYFTYFSPRSLFFLPDPDPQRSIPELPVFYFWMVIPYVFGLTHLWKKRKQDYLKFIILLLILSPIPASLVNDPFSTYRALPLLLPMTLLMFLGYQELFNKLGKSVFKIVSVLAVLISVALLYRSYFVLLPNERASEWDYGNKQLAQEILKNPNMQFVVDQSRKKPVYMHLLFFMQYPPERYQQEIDFDISDYYQNISFDQNMRFSNIELRGIDWEEDIYKKQILVGDNLAISDNQASEHFLEKQFEIISPDGNVSWVGYLTNPKLKCLSDPRNVHCLSNINH